MIPSIPTRPESPAEHAVGQSAIRARKASSIAPHVEGELEAVGRSAGGRVDHVDGGVARCSKSERPAVSGSSVSGIEHLADDDSGRRGHDARRQQVARDVREIAPASIAT